MSIKTSNGTDFANDISTGTVLVDFYRNDCTPCKMLAPVVDDIANELPDLPIIKLNLTEYENIGEPYGFRAAPVLAVFKDGVLVNALMGYQPFETILEFLTPYL